MAPTTPLNAASTAAAQILTGGAMTLMLNQLANRVQQLIDQAGLQGDRILLQAGRQILLAIDQFRIVFSDELNKATTNVTNVTNNFFNRIQTETNNLVPLMQSANSSLGLAQQIINTVPGANRATQVTKRTYTYRNNIVDLTFHGVFFYVAQGYQASLSITNLLGHPVLFQPTNNTTQAITFSIPVNQLFLAPYPAAAQMTLNVQRPDQGFNVVNMVVGRVVTDTFRSTLFSLPNTWQATVNWSAPNTTTKTQKKSQQYIQSSADHWGRVGHDPDTRGAPVNRDCRSINFTSNYSPSPTRGWTISGSDYHIILDRRGGHSNTHSSISRDPTVPNTYRVWTQHVGRHRSGGIWFRIDYTEEQMQTTQLPQSQGPFSLNWGNSIVVPCGINPWTVSFTDGVTTQQFGAPKSTLLIDIASANTGVSIAAPSQINVDF